MMMKKMTTTAILSTVLITGAAFAGNSMTFDDYERLPDHSRVALAGLDHGKETAQARKASMDIVDTAVSAGSFNTLVTAVKQAGLVETLKGDGPFTVFAPTDEAFSKIPSDKLNALLADKKALTEVLTYHVVAGKVMSQDVVKLTSAETIQGQSVRIDASSGVKIDDARVIKADIETSNGVIHVIDSVILPSS
jgi:uncharacterized surface protein with fasciclin (FAS1) repeats